MLGEICCERDRDTMLSSDCRLPCSHKLFFEMPIMLFALFRWKTRLLLTVTNDCFIYVWVWSWCSAERAWQPVTHCQQWTRYAHTFITVETQYMSCKLSYAYALVLLIYMKFWDCHSAWWPSLPALPSSVQCACVCVYVCLLCAAASHVIPSWYSWFFSFLLTKGSLQSSLLKLN